MKYLIMCIGNKNSGDDGIGPYIANRLKQKNLKNLVIINCGTIPENYTAFVKQNPPEKLILIDAVEMDLPPGEIRIIPKEKIGTMHISTHNIPVSVLIQYLEEFVETIYFIGLQPKNLSGNMNQSVQESGERLINLIVNNNLGQIKTLH